MHNTLIAISLAVLASAACSTEDPGVELDPIDPAGTHHTFIVDSITLSTTAAQANQFGLDLDGDAQGRIDNGLAQILSVLMNVGEDYRDRVVAELSERITNAELIHLFSIQTVATADASGVGFHASLGSDPDGDPSDNWPGPEDYDVVEFGDASSGSIAGGIVSARGGSVPLALALPNLSSPVVFDLRGAAIEATLTGDGLEGKVGGAIAEADIDRVLVPVLQLALQEIVDEECPASCPEDSTGALVLRYFDEDEDGAISLEDVRTSNLTASLLAPDVDLFNADGNYEPLGDGVKDSLSFGVGFTAVPANFDVATTP